MDMIDKNLKGKTGAKQGGLPEYLLKDKGEKGQQMGGGNIQNLLAKEAAGEPLSTKDKERIREYRKREAEARAEQEAADGEGA